MIVFKKTTMIFETVSRHQINFFAFKGQINQLSNHTLDKTLH